MPVGPRVSKEEFMNALGLTQQDEQYYRAMRDEAINIYNLMNQDPSNLLDSVRVDHSTRPPFFWHHIRPECQRWGILEIWRTAGPHTRPLFDRGATCGEYGPNWVAGWLLYSVFRSRDIRNNRNRRKGDDPDKRKQSEEPQQEQPQPPKKGYYDPVRNGTV